MKKSRFRLSRALGLGIVIFALTGALVGQSASANTTGDWNISVDGSCPIGVLTFGLLPTWTVHETTGQKPPSTLHFTEKLTQTYTSYLPGPLGAINASAAIPVLSAYFIVQIPGSFVMLPLANTFPGFWLISPVVPGISGLKHNPNGTYSVSVTLTRPDVQLHYLSAGGTATYTYAITVTTPNLPGLGVTTSWELAAKPGNGGSNANDDSAAMVGTIGVTQCRRAS